MRRRNTPDLQRQYLPLRYEDIAEAAWFLGSSVSKNITGAELTVDGGMSCQLYPVRLNEWKRKAWEM